MAYFCAAFARTDAGWIGVETDLSEVDGLDDIAGIMREAAVETAGETVLLLVEHEDDWFAVVRIDGEEDPRVFLSDGTVAHRVGLAGFLAERLPNVERVPAEEPFGDRDVLTDLGVSPATLTSLGERTLPGDALSVIAGRAGFAEEYDRLR